MHHGVYSETNSAPVSRACHGVFNGCRGFLQHYARICVMGFHYQYAHASWGLVEGREFSDNYAHMRHGVFMRRKWNPRCGAKTRKGTPCIAAAIWSPKSRRYTRCRNHGGLSTGPKTAEGIERIRAAAKKRRRQKPLCEQALTDKSSILQWRTKDEDDRFI